MYEKLLGEKLSWKAAKKLCSLFYFQHCEAGFHNTELYTTGLSDFLHSGKNFELKPFLYFLLHPRDLTKNVFSAIMVLEL